MQKLKKSSKRLCCLLFILMVSITTVKSENSSFFQRTNITIDMKSVELSVILKEIEEQTGLSFFFSNETLDVKKIVTLRVDNVPLEKALQMLLGNKYDFSRKDDYIVIKQKVSPQDDPKFVRRKIEGIVTDKNGVPVPGVSVVVKSTYIGVATNANGRFIIEYKSDARPILQFSCIGFRTQEVNFEGKESIIVQLETDKIQIDELIVTGYAKIEKGNFTGSAITVDRDELLTNSPGTVIQSLEIFDPSFNLMENNDMGSDPNTMPDITIRGSSAIDDSEFDDYEDLSEESLRNNPNMPTFIMDGFEVSVQRIYDLDPTRIKSISILKDAASTAIYGSRAANGVVVIETIEPQAGKLKVNYSLNSSITFPDLSDYNLLNANEKLELETMAGVFDIDDTDNLNSALTIEESYYEKMMQVNRGVNTYWLSKPLQTALNQKHNVLIEGGSKEFIIGLNLKVGLKDGIMIGSERNTNAIGFSVKYQKNKLYFNNYIEWNSIKSSDSQYGSFSTYTALNPYDTYLDDDGNYLEELTNWYGHTNFENPLYDAHLNSYDKKVKNEFTNNFHFKWFIADNFRLDSRVAISNNRSERQVFKDPASSEFINDDFMDKGSKTIYNTNYTSVDCNAFLVYSKSLNLHHLNMMLGGNVQQIDEYISSYSVVGFPTGSTDDVSFAAQIDDTPKGLSDLSRTTGLFSSLNYTYNDTYLLDFSGRYDGASQFGNNTKYAPFWSIGAGINVHKYKTVSENFPWINMLKVRSNYGQLGKASYSQSLARSTYEYNFNDWYIDGIGATLETLGNEDLEWEKTRMFDVGFDLLAFNKLSIVANYYNKNTKDLIGDITLPISTGFTSFVSNLGEIVNKGVEINARYNAINKKDLSLYLFGTASHNTNKFVEIYDALEEYNLLVEEYYEDNPSVSVPLNKYYEGASQTAIYAMKSLGINPADGQEIYLDSDGNVTYDWSASDLVVVGDTQAKLRGSFGANVRYKSFYLYAGFVYELGGQAYNSTLVSKVENADVYENVDKRVFNDRWQTSGDVTCLKDIQDWDNPTQVTSRFVQDNNTLSFNSLTLGYNVPKDFISKYNIERCKVQLTANDLAYFSTIKRERGLTYPYARTINLSLYLTF